MRFVALANEITGSDYNVFIGAFLLFLMDECRIISMNSISILLNVDY